MFRALSTYFDLFEGRQQRQFTKVAMKHNPRTPPSTMNRICHQVNLLSHGMTSGCSPVVLTAFRATTPSPSNPKSPQFPPPSCETRKYPLSPQSAPLNQKVSGNVGNTTNVGKATKPWYLVTYPRVLQLPKRGIATVVITNQQDGMIDTVRIFAGAISIICHHPSRVANHGITIGRKRHRHWLLRRGTLE